MSEYSSTHNRGAFIASVFAMQASLPELFEQPHFLKNLAHALEVEVRANLSPRV